MCGYDDFLMRGTLFGGVSYVGSLKRKEEASGLVFASG